MPCQTWYLIRVICVLNPRKLQRSRQPAHGSRRALPPAQPRAAVPTFRGRLPTDARWRPHPASSSLGRDIRGDGGRQAQEGAVPVAPRGRPLCPSAPRFAHPSIHAPCRAAPTQHSPRPRSAVQALLIECHPRRRCRFALQPAADQPMPPSGALRHRCAVAGPSSELPVQECAQHTGADSAPRCACVPAMCIR